MSRASTSPPGSSPKTITPGSRRANAAAIIGSALEFYDFTLYGIAATLVFGQLFFPGSDPTTATIQALATFAVGFLFRPIGGIVFGRLGDRIGRKKVLILTLVLMGAASTLIGLLPTYDQIGVAAPVLLVFLRIVQGLGASAEFGSATIVAIEFAKDKKRGLAGSLPGTGIWAGNVLATLLMSLVALLPAEDFLSWGWRLPFLFSITLFVFGLWLRAGLPETPVFEELTRTKTKERSPLLSVFRTDWKAVLVVMACAYGTAAIAYFYQVFGLTYARTQLGLPPETTLIGTLAGGILAMIMTPLFGILTDRIGRRPVLIFGFLFSAVHAFVFFAIMSPGAPWPYWLGMLAAIGIGNAAIFASGGTFFAELFAAKHRASGFGVSREFANAVGAAITPLIAVQILAASGGGTVWLSVFVAAAAGLALVGVILSRETFRSSVAANPDADPIHGSGDERAETASVS